ncbi:Hypothetical protein HEAR0647 [Herminiimonas arsenicoxydans]|uniref:Uncharacterized protein n=1 Tax=Herminiimonas arsenicoxydans TaxID=204773 RepID=A4G2V7_HERAR|nr:Hypothetical protein HEAR0647 [Herminiimonas arsenicoxydans]
MIFIFIRVFTYIQPKRNDKTITFMFPINFVYKQHFLLLPWRCSHLNNLFLHE